MSLVMVRYRVKAERANENERDIARVFAELEQRRPAGLRYASFKLPDGVSFVHVASISGDTPNPLLELPAFRAFIAAVKARCEELPVSIELREIGSYGSSDQ